MQYCYRVWSRCGRLLVYTWCRIQWIDSWLIHDFCWGVLLFELYWMFTLNTRLLSDFIRYTSHTNSFAAVFCIFWFHFSSTRKFELLLLHFFSVSVSFDFRCNSLGLRFIPPVNYSLSIFLWHYFCSNKQARAVINGKNIDDRCNFLA